MVGAAIRNVVVVVTGWDPRRLRRQHTPRPALAGMEVQHRGVAERLCFVERPWQLCFRETVTLEGAGKNAKVVCMSPAVSGPVSLCAACGLNSGL